MATHGFSKEGAERIVNAVRELEKRGGRTHRRHRRNRGAGGGRGATGAQGDPGAKGDPGEQGPPGELPTSAFIQIAVPMAPPP